MVYGFIRSVNVHDCFVNAWPVSRVTYPHGRYNHCTQTLRTVTACLSEDLACAIISAYIHLRVCVDAVTQHRRLTMFADQIRIYHVLARIQFIYLFVYMIELLMIITLLISITITVNMMVTSEYTIHKSFPQKSPACLSSTIIHT